MYSVHCANCRYAGALRSHVALPAAPSISLKSPRVSAPMIIVSACELRGSKHGQPLARNPKPFADGGAEPAAAVGHSVRLPEHAGLNGCAGG